MLAVFPQLGDLGIPYAWGGFVDITMNKAPDFGRLGHNIYYLQGFSGHGLALAGMAGKLVALAIAGPTLAGLGSRAETTLKDPGYKGEAKDAPAYIRESIVNPHAYLVPGPTYSNAGRSFMPDHYGKTLKPGEIDDLVAYLGTVK